MSLCILTNNAALFPPIASPGEDLIRCLSLTINGNEIVTPCVQDFKCAFNELEREFNSILVLTPSEAILPGTKIAQSAAQSHGGPAIISVLDTQQIGPGLGILARAAAQKAAAGASLFDVEEHIRAISPYLFTLICPETISRQNIDEVSNEQTSNQKIFSIEQGHLTLYKKVRTQRHLLENLQEFLEEFEKPQQLVYFHGNNCGMRFRSLRESAGEHFPNIYFNELELNGPLINVFGSQALGLTVMELQDSVASILEY